MTDLTIPRTVDRCVDALAEAGALITAKEWHRAAIVAALVGPAPGHGGRPTMDQKQSITRDGLAAKGIVGLSSPATVERYRDAWCAVRPVPALGEVVDLDGLPDWPPNTTVGRGNMTPERRETLMAAGRDAGMRAGSKVVDIAANPRALAAAIKADPATARVAVEALGEVADKPTPRTKPDPSPWPLLVRARTLTRDLERLVRDCSGVPMDADTRDGLRAIHARMVTGCDFLGSVIQSDGITDMAIHEWLGEAR